MITLGLILVAISAFCDGVRDVLAHAFERSVFSELNPKFWDPTKSGRNKWKDGKRELGEVFPFSTTLLVFTTEGWHLFKMLFTFTLFLGLCFVGYSANSFGQLILFGVIARVVFGVVFTLSYKYLKT